MSAVSLIGLVILCQSAAASTLNWRSWSDQVFAEARAHNKLVLLDLEAVWCHWCHVMEEKTYGNRQVAALLKKHFILVRADQDADPALSTRYGDWGWPATILFAPDGTELAKLQGYIPPARMRALLAAFIKDPTPGPSALASRPVVKASTTTFLTRQQRARLLATYNAVYDRKHAGWGTVHKFIHTDSMDYAMSAAINGDQQAAQRAQATLDAALNLLDPVWGGVYQYSDEVNWRSPHYEKIMWYQTQYLRHYALAARLWNKPAYRKAADNIYRYLTRFMLSPDGAFYTSQNADLNKQVDGKTFYALDDAGRRAFKAIPRIDRHIYARENGWAIRALAVYADMTGQAEPLKIALRAADRMLAERRLPGQDLGFSHGADASRGVFLGDNLAMASAMLQLYFSTGERQWLTRAIQIGHFIQNRFYDPEGGYWSSASTGAAIFKKPVRQIEENIRLARFANLLFQTSGKPVFKTMAAHAMRYLTSDDITGMRRFLIGIVLADAEISSEPQHITIVGARRDPQAQALHKAARQVVNLYQRLDWRDPAEGPMLNPDVQYPALDKPALFACANGICSLPAFTAGELADRLARMQPLRQQRKTQQSKTQ